MAWLNPKVLIDAGFAKIPDDAELESSFLRLNLYRVKGMILADDDYLGTTSGFIDGVSWKLAVGGSVNKVTQALTDDNWIDDEEAWIEERKIRGPFALLQFGPTKTYQAAGDLYKEENDIVTTYQCFLEARSDLRSMALVIQPMVCAAVCLSLSSDSHKVDLVLEEELNYGTHGDGRTIRDLDFHFSADVSAVYPKESEQIDLSLTQSSLYCSRLPVKAARQYSLGLAEDDRLKAFLFFFLTIEIFVHSEFQFSADAEELGKAIRAKEYGVEAFGQLMFRKMSDIKSLSDRFVWNVGTKWNGLGDAEIEEFRFLKKIRDGIGHGKVSDVDQDSLNRVRTLASQLLQTALT